MISSITGTIFSVAGNMVEIDTKSGVTYTVSVPLVYATQLHIGEALRIHTYLKVGEQSSDLYGFRDAQEREFFLRLISVSGVGPKTALQVLSCGNSDALLDAISRGDVAYLTAVQGIGKKTAERIVVELKNKVAPLSAISGGVVSAAVSDVLSALHGLGYAEAEAKLLLRDMDTEGKDTQTLLKEVLKKAKQ